VIEAAATGPATGTGTFGSMFRNACVRHAGRAAITDRDDTRGYTDLLTRSARLANALRGAGLRPGDPIAAMLEDRVSSLEVYGAGALGGFPVVHVNDRLAAPEVAHILQHSGARAFFHTDGRSAVAADIDGVDELPLFVTLGSDRPPKARGYEDLLAAASPDVVLTPREQHDIALVGYTSGTTGFPKGAMISNGALVAAVRLIPSQYRISNYGRCAFTGTLSFVAGIWGVLLPHLVTGGTITFLHPYTPESWARHIEADRSTFSYAPSPLIPAFAEQLRAHPGALQSLDTVIHSGSTVPRAHTEALVDVLGDRYLESWGMTEGIAPFSATTREDWRGRTAADDIFASAGRAFPSARIQALGPDGEPLPPGGTGDLVVDTDIRFSGYLGDPDATAASLGPHGFRTGDVGHLDAAGYVYITGRAKDMIISGGANVYPAEVENALALLPGIAECAVVGMPDARWGEAVTAAVVLRPGISLTEDDVVTHVRRHLAGYKRPQRVHFLEALPRNASMKVRKDDLRATLAALDQGTDGV
jgi:long-chain acyl-CoA synthetase